MNWAKLLLCFFSRIWNISLGDLPICHQNLNGWNRVFLCTLLRDFLHMVSGRQGKFIYICFYNLWKIFIIFKNFLEMVPATFWSASMHTFSNIYFLTLEKRRTQPPSKIFHFYWILILTSYYRIFDICDPLE